MTLVRLITIMAVGITLGACASSPDGPQPAGAAPSSMVPERGLPAQTLEIGECGIFLWQVSGEPTFVFFAKSADNAAKMLIGDTPRELILEASGGEIFGQFQTEQTWLSVDTGHRVALAVSPGEPMIDGQQVPRGRISVLNPEGWETVIPVSGVTACMERPQPSNSPIG